VTVETSRSDVASRTRRERYGVALVATAAGCLIATVLLEVSSDPIYAPLAGAVLLSAWYGGVGPAALSLAVGWTAALGLFVEPRGEFTSADTDDMTRWVVNLAVGVLIVVFAGAQRLGRRRATEAVLHAESSLGHAGALQTLSADLAGAASSAEVSHALAQRAAELFGAQGAALALLESDDVLVVDPIGLAASLHVPGRRIPLGRRTALTAAIREDGLVRANERDALERDFPDSAAILPRQVQSIVAVPLRVAGKPYGVVEFLFDRPGAVDDELAAVAATVAVLAEQALERARLYDRERETRTALDRILQVAPRFYADSAEEVTTAICREARTTFGGDYGVLWQINDGELELVRSDPRREEWPQGLRVPLRDFPGLEDAVTTLGISFVEDVLDEARGEGLDRVRQLGIRSSLRSPIAIGGRAELVLAVSWQTVVDEPDPTTIAIVRRFADQAGLAIGQLERRRAEAEAAARADETKRLQEVTAALSTAATRVEVGDACLEHALRSVGAEAGFVVLRGVGGTGVQMISIAGLSDEAVEAWSALGLDADAPFARAILSGDPVWALTRDEMRAFTGAPALDDAGWVSVPLKTTAGVHGALHISLPEPRDLSAGERSRLQTIVSQCALALERSQLYDDEQRLRQRSERLQRMTAKLSNAVTQSEVAEVLVEAAVENVAAATASLYAVNEEREVAGLLAAHGVEAAGPESNGEIPLDEDSSIAQVVRQGAWSSGSTAGDEDAARSALVIPLVAGRRSVGALELGWDEPTILSADERVFVETLAGQGAQALERARHFESERSIAETLQRSVLPVALPRLAGAQIAARYLPGTLEVDVGGDWFDAIELSDGRVGLIVGDVVGKGVQAAASMGQLRNALRAISIERLKPPSALARLDRLATDALDTSFATVVYAVVDRTAGVLRFSSAGHPPPVVAYPDGRVELLEDGRGLPLGTGLGPKYRQCVVELPAGSIVVLYSDGLVERRGHTIDEGIERLVHAVATGPKDAERMLEHVLEHLVAGEDRADDVAILAARFLPVAPKPLDLTVQSEAQSLHLVRDAIRTWLEGTELERGEAEDLLLATWEICANAIEHAASPTEQTIRVRATHDQSRVRVVVDDSGRFVQVQTRPDRGLGLRLAEHLSSALSITMTEDGTSVALEKLLPEGDAPL
jgi:serine phosphatase RsbU (regulator of sigma subunit)/anti-sigma regulatory factor (Ser/Thr protein kinase)/transcriptional regulator with GAF, ATPase, and Fis domain